MEYGVDALTVELLHSLQFLQLSILQQVLAELLMQGHLVILRAYHFLLSDTQYANLRRIARANAIFEREVPRTACSQITKNLADPRCDSSSFLVGVEDYDRAIAFPLWF